MDEINIRDIEGFRVGSYEDKSAATGCTVIISEEGASAGADVRGGAPATRETDLLRPENMVQKINAVVLSGGSAFGLEAGDGVMANLRMRQIGFETGFGKVPIVCGASLFDLVCGNPDVFPNKEMGFRAADNAFEETSLKSGNYGGGTGATCGKINGVKRMMKSGMGIYAVQAGDLKVGAIVCTNPLGDIFDEDGKRIAGLMNEDATGLSSTEDFMISDWQKQRDVYNGNTTIACVITNADLNKSQCCKTAQISHDGIARAIRPVHTSADGDSVFVMASSEVTADFDTVSLLAALTVQRAIIRGTLEASHEYGIKCAKDFI